MLLKLSRRAVAFGWVAMGISGFAAAAPPPSTGLGEAWPSATDVSLNPHYHVYVFMRDGIRYIQVNDASGTVIGAVATANGTALALPIGRDASWMRILDGASTSRASAATNSAAASQVIYRDAATTITATPLSDAATQVNVEVCSDPTRCSG
jgi:hypothetical protein